MRYLGMIGVVLWVVNCCVCFDGVFSSGYLV